MHRVAQAQFGITQQLATIGIQYDVLRGAEQGEQGGDPGDGVQITLRRKRPHRGDHRQQTELRQQHPTAPPPEQWHHIAIQQRRPQKFPRVGKLDQRKQADSFEVNMFAAQPRRYKIKK